MTYVVDASIIIRLLASRREDETLRHRLTRTLHAPALIDAEVSNVVRRLTITPRKEAAITAERGRIMLDRYAGLRIVRYPMQPLQRRAFELRNNWTAYDAMYVALAEVLDVPLLTDDGKYAGAPGHHADIVEYPN
jgi:predicted nucleic acid-binding protein